MRDVAFVGLVILGVLTLLLLAAATAGAAIGLFLGALLWAVQLVAGPFSPDGATPWWLLALVAVVFLTDALRHAREHRADRGSA